MPRNDVEWEAKAVFNPSVFKDQGVFHMVYRTYPKILEEGAPRYKRPGRYLINQASYIGYAQSTDGIHFERRDFSLIAPDQEYDRYGCEDPRITKIGDTFYITYTAIDAPLDKKKEYRPNIRIALATTKDFVTIEKRGIIGPSVQSKAAAFFPDFVAGGRIGLLMTINADSVNSRIAIRYYDSIDDILTSRSDKDWGHYFENPSIVFDTAWWLHRGPELGAPPIKTDKGWLIIFSAESMSDTWTIGAALLDLENPQKLIARVPGYLLQPVTAYERDGLVPQVTFPGGAVIVDDELYVYYGCADTVIGLARCRLTELLAYLEACRQ